MDEAENFGAVASAKINFTAARGTRLKECHVSETSSHKG